MNEHERLIRQFYSAFQKGDFKTMQNSYHQEASFSDPVFGNLSAPEVRAMWEMLIKAARDLKVSAADFIADKDSVVCTWQAWYTFSKTGRPVHNIIHATFHFRDGLIFTHRDEFDFYRWSRQALGAKGILLGWTPLVRNAVRTTARKGLTRFINAQA